MKVLLVEPMKHPRPVEIPHALEAMQELVGGYISADTSAHRTIGMTPSRWWRTMTGWQKPTAC